ncbi:MAG: hypothetical protein AAF358_13475 [Pseudomonadota bacterium]
MYTLKFMSDTERRFIEVASFDVHFRLDGLVVINYSHYERWDKLRHDEVVLKDDLDHFGTLHVINSSGAVVDRVHAPAKIDLEKAA